MSGPSSPSANLSPTIPSSSSSHRLNGSSSSKGKQRERLSSSGITAGEAQPPPLPGISFCIKFTDGTTQDLKDLYVNESEPVREVKRRIRLLRDSTSTCRLRIIYNGRIITDGTRLVPWITAILRRQKQQEDEQARRLADSIRDGVHALERGFKNAYESSAPDQKGRQTGGDAKSPSLASEGKGKCKQKEGEQIANPDTLDKLIWLHCSVGEPGSLATEEEEAAASAATQSAQSRTQPLSGFDRLREVGFSEEEIENMRRQFHVDGPSDTTVAGDEDEHARALEEQWMEGFGQNGGNANSDLSPNSRMYETLFFGVIAGFFFPFLPLFFFKAENAIFSKRMQMAIVAGLSINVLYGALRAFA